jgi:hypothetical protein
MGSSLSFQFHDLRPHFFNDLKSHLVLNTLIPLFGSRELPLGLARSGLRFFFGKISRLTTFHGLPVMWRTFSSRER